MVKHSTKYQQQQQQQQQQQTIQTSFVKYEMGQPKEYGVLSEKWRRVFYYELCHMQ